jgi:peptidyl-prolyl cis-trans isomerase SurA
MILRAHPKPLTVCSTERGWRRGHLCAVLLLAAGMLPAGGVGPAFAQAPSVPGLVVTMPSGPPTGSVQPPPGVFVSPPAPPPAAASPPPPKAKKAVTTDKPRRSKPKPRTAAADDGPAPRSSSSRIVALVNDEPITDYEIQQRSRFMALSADIRERAQANMKAFAQNPRTNERLKEILQETIQANQGKTREQVIAAFEARKKAYVMSLQKQAVENARSSMLPGMKKKALDELIEERLKLQEAKKLSVTVAQADVDKVFADMAKRNKMSSEEFVRHIASQGASASVIKSRLKASLAWRDVVRRRYGHHINVSQGEIERLATQAGGEETVELRLQRLTLAGTGAVDQKALAARLGEANELRGAFKGCSSTAGLAKGRANTRFEDLGYQKPGAIQEPVRSLLLAAKDGEMLPANLGASGVELYAVCGRRTQKLDEEKRQAAENQLTMKEFEKLAERYLYDLRKDALIEMR